LVAGETDLVVDDVAVRFEVAQRKAHGIKHVLHRAIIDVAAAEEAAPF
jgi:hypothetical protein